MPECADDVEGSVDEEEGDENVVASHALLPVWRQEGEEVVLGDFEGRGKSGKNVGKGDGAEKPRDRSLVREPMCIWMYGVCVWQGC